MTTATGHPIWAPPIINEEKLRRLLTLCTTEAPFRHINGTMCRQVDGVAMGSALGVTFANYYMAHIEYTVISDLTVKPKLYARYVVDCFLVVEDEQHLELIRREFQNKSVLKFTKEISINNRLNLLDVAIDSKGGFTWRDMVRIHAPCVYGDTKWGSYEPVTRITAAIHWNEFVMRNTTEPHR